MPRHTGCELELRKIGKVRKVDAPIRLVCEKESKKVEVLKCTLKASLVPEEACLMRALSQGPPLKMAPIS